MALKSMLKYLSFYAAKEAKDMDSAAQLQPLTLVAITWLVICI